MTQPGMVGAAAARGQLRLETGVAEKCVSACDRFLESLNDVRALSNWMTTRTAFGILESAQQLGGKFERKAVGERGFAEVIQLHIDAVLQLRDLFEKAGRAYGDADARSANIVASQTGGG